MSPPLGLAYVAASLIEGGFATDALDLNVSGLNLDRVERIVRAEGPRIVGISALTETYPNALAIARRLKASDPTVAVVIGGAHATLLPEEVLRESVVDHVVVGEGETAMLALTRHLLLGQGDVDVIPGVGYKRSGSGDASEIRVNERGPIRDRGGLPYPARDLFPLELYRDPWTVLTSRGACPFRCPFCSVPTIWKGERKTVPRDPDSVVAEVRYLAERYGADRVYFVDDVFTLRKQWVYRLIQGMRTLPGPITWSCSTRADLVDMSLLRAMHEAGCGGIQFGVESGAQDMLDSVKQRVRKSRVIEAVRAAREVGIDVLCSFMVPFPEDTEATLRETKDFINELRALGSRIVLSYTTPYPGTYFYEHAEELGLRLLTRDWGEFDAKHNVIETRHLSAADIDRLVREIVVGSDLQRSV